MKIQRTANAGVLLTLDDAQILLDGLCGEVEPYLATPPAVVRSLMEHIPDAAAFTHLHPDHYNPEYAESCGSVVILPNGAERSLTVGTVQIMALPTRHMGKAGLKEAHQSFVLRGSQCVWFLGDAAPTELKKLMPTAKPDVLMVPYPYVSTPAALKQVEALLPCKIVLLHLPAPNRDPEGLWQRIQAAVESLGGALYIPQMGQILEL